MGAQLFAAYPELVAQADEILGYSVESLCLADEDRLLDQTQYTQPALFVVNALSFFQRMDGAEPPPDFVAGHSLGEYNALLAAGVFDFATGLRLVKKRGELMARVTDGGMAAVVGLTAGQVSDLLREPGLESLSVANYNNPTQTVIAGPRADVEAARAVFEGAGAGLYTVLRVSGAFHSPHMESVRDEFAAFLADFTFAEPTVPVVSNVTARPYGPDVADALVRQLTHPVRWTDSVRYLIDQGVEDIRQIGPGRALSGLVQAIQKDAQAQRDGQGTSTGTATEAASAPAPDAPAAAVPRTTPTAELRLRRPERRRAATPQSARDDGDTLFTLLFEELKEALTRVVRFDPHRLTPETELSALGFDSLKLIEFADHLTRELGVDLTPQVFFEHFTVGAFTRHLVTEHRERIAARYGATAPGTAAASAPETGEPVGAPAPVAAVRPISDEARPGTAVAIVGLSAVLPGSEDVEEFWQHLVAGTELVTEIPPDRWAAWADEEPPRRAYGALLKAVDAFDCRFFGISPSEAELMDPHQRILMETVWKAIEDAGRRPGELAGTRTGLFAGHGSMDWLDVLSHSAAGVQSHTATGLSHAILPNRISHHLDLHGPSEAIDTACSSSLVAVHRAVASLREGECDLAIAAGVNLLLSPVPYTSFQKAGMLAPDGRCKTFDRAADGYVRGEGAVAVVLKPLERALADGDHVHAVIRGSVVNHGGRSASLTAPNPDAQADLVATAWRHAGLDPATATYVEAHGTGTSLGDPIEIEGLKKAFATLYREWGHPAPSTPHVGIGSVKTSIGHLEAAAGLAGVVKMVQALRYGRLPALRHFGELNPFVRLDGSPLRIVDTTTEWERLRDAEGAEIPRRCGVSSFGFGGTNAHVVLEEFVPRTAPSDASGEAGRAHAGPHLVPLSARTPEALRRSARALVDWLDVHHPRGGSPDFDLTALADTLQSGREAMTERLALVVDDADDLYDGLVRFLRGEGSGEGVHTGSAAGAAALSRALLEGAEGTAYFSALVRAGAVDKLAQLWVAGAELDWAAVRGQRPVRRLPLPTYPFERRRCWPQDLGPHGTSGDPAIPPAPAVAPPAAVAQAAPAGAAVTDAQVRDHLVTLFAQTLGWRPEEVDPAAGFDELGLNSLVIEKLRRRLVDHYGPFDTTTFYVYKNLGDLARHVAERARDLPAPAPAPAETTPPAPATAAATAAPAARPALSASGGGSAPDGGIAIIGMSGRYPGAPTLAAYWDNLRRGVDCVTEIPLDRPGYRRYAELARERYGESWYRWGGFLDDVDAFDPQFFHISPREARLLDPQERLFLETAWETLEDAGYTRSALADPTAGDARGPVGVFAGVTYNNYQMFAGRELDRGHWQPVASQTFSIANRVSYLLNLGGPSLTVDTACSSSLYAVHLACASIRRGECDLALAGGVNLSLHPSKYVMLAEMGFLAEDGRCRAFGEGGTGYVPAEAVGAVLLKPLERALADGDQIYAVIKGSAANSDGHTYGYSVPNPVAQAELVRAALRDAGVSAETISYVEAHGTGTSLGDPIEIRGLTDAYAAFTDATQFCAIGSVKSVIGHAEAAAGIAQITKVALQLRHGTLTPTLLHSATTNPHLDLTRTPFTVQREAAVWERPRPGGGATVPRRAGISSFGAGGANVHLVLEEAPAPAVAPPPVPGRQLVFPLSAREPENLRAYAARLAAFLREASPSTRLVDVAHTLQRGREAMEHRAAFVAADRAEAVARFEEIASGAAGGSGRFWSGRVQGRGTPPDASPGATPAQVAAAWCEGAEPDWDALHEGVEPRRISLPTYPFSRQRYWLPEPAPVTPSAAAPVTPSAASPPALGGNDAPAPGAGPDSDTLLARLAAAPEGERQQILAGYMQAELGRLLQFPPDAPPDRKRGFFELGMDSVMSVRLGNVLEELLGVELYSSVTFDYPCIDDLTGYLLEILPLDGPAATAAPAPVPAADAAPRCQTIHYSAAWEPAAAPAATTAPPAGPVLVFDADGPLTERITAEHTGTGPVLAVRPGARFAQDEDGFTLRPGNGEDYAALLAALDSRPAAIVHAWPDDRGGLTSVFHLTRELLRGKVSRPVRLLRVEPYTEAAPDPAAEAFGGFARSVRHENPHLVQQALCVQVPGTSAADGARALARAVTAELAADGTDVEVRHDAAGRHVRRLRELAAPTGPDAVAVRDGGVYVISGGGGGLGLIFAEHLARQAAVRLVLVGRSPLDDTRRAALERLRQSGAEAVYEAADVGDRAEVHRIVDAARSRWGAVHGVIHSAGVLRDALVPNKTVEEMDAVLAGKVGGARHLDEATREDALDFFMMFSSLAALAGNPGQVDYAYASRFLNAFGRHRERLRERGERSGVSITVVWPFWRDGGMRVDAGTEGFVRRRLGLEHLPTQLGVEAFDLALRCGEPEFGVVLAERARLDRVLRIEPRPADAPAPDTGPADARQPHGTAPRGVAAELLDTLQELGF